MEKKIETIFFDIDTVDGLAESAYYNVIATPSIIILNDKDKEIIGWRSEVPTLEELSKWI